MYTTVQQVRCTSGCKSITPADVTDADVEQFILDAQRIIDGTLKRDYVVPFADNAVPGEVRTLCKWYAAYLVMSEYPDKVFEKDIDNARIRFSELLKQITSGVIELVGVDKREDAQSDVTVESTIRTSRW